MKLFLKLEELLAEADTYKDPLCCASERTIIVVSNLACRLRRAVDEIDGMEEAMRGLLETLDERTDAGTRLSRQLDKMLVARDWIKEPEKQ